MIGLLVTIVLAVAAILGGSMLFSPESYVEQRVVPVLRRRLVCQLAGLVLLATALAGAAMSFISFALSNYTE